MSNFQIKQDRGFAKTVQRARSVRVFSEKMYDKIMEKQARQLIASNFTSNSKFGNLPQKKKLQALKNVMDNMEKVSTTPRVSIVVQLSYVAGAVLFVSNSALFLASNLTLIPAFLAGASAFMVVGGLILSNTEKNASRQKIGQELRQAAQSALEKA